MCIQTCCYPPSPARKMNKNNRPKRLKYLDLVKFHTENNWDPNTKREGWKNIWIDHKTNKSTLTNKKQYCSNHTRPELIVRPPGRSCIYRKFSEILFNLLQKSLIDFLNTKYFFFCESQRCICGKKKSFIILINLSHLL